MRKHVTPADPLADIHDPSRGIDLPPGGLDVEFTSYWIGLAARYDIIVSDPIEPGANGPGPVSPPVLATDRFVVRRGGDESTFTAAELVSYLAPLLGGVVTPPVLGPTTASFVAGTSAGSLVAAITGLSAGETATSISPNDGRLAITSGSALVVGLSASSAGTISYTVTTSAGRTLTVAVTVSASVPALAPVGTQTVFWGDGVMAEGSAASLRNGPTIAMLKMGGRLNYSPAWMQAASGGDMDTIYARRAFAIGQKAGMAVFSSQGHNDGLMTTDPDIDPIYLNKFKRNLDAWIDGNPFTTAGGKAYYIPVVGTLPSDVSAETFASSFNAGITRRKRVADLQAAYVASKNDARIFYIDLSDYVPSTYANDTGNVHPGNPGGLFIGNRLFAALDTRVEAATKEQVLAQLIAGTYLGLTGANLHPDTLMAGTAGTKGVATGEYADGQTLTIGLTGVSVAASKEDLGGGYSRQRVTLTGTNTVEGNLVLTDTGNISVPSAERGDYYLFAEELILDKVGGGSPTGMWRLAGTTGSLGVIGGTQPSDASLVAPSALTLDTVAMVAPRASFGAGLTVSPSFTVRYGAYDLTGNRVGISRPTLYKVSTPAQSPAMYLGGDGILGSNFQMRINNSGGAVAGGTLTIEPGQWAPYGLTFSAKRFYKGGGAGGAAGTANLGTGVLLFTTTTAGVWAWTHAANTLAVNDLVYCEVDGVSATGATFTARCNTPRTMT